MNRYFIEFRFNGKPDLQIIEAKSEDEALAKFSHIHFNERESIGFFYISKMERITFPFELRKEDIDWLQNLLSLLDTDNENDAFIKNRIFETLKDVIVR